MTLLLMLPHDTIIMMMDSTQVINSKQSDPSYPAAGLLRPKSSQQVFGTDSWTLFLVSTILVCSTLLQIRAS